MTAVFNLNTDERALLLRIARESIIHGLAKRPIEKILNLPEKLDAPCGAFVTLHRGGKLRGCIGRVKAAGQLAYTIQDMARAAAFSDPRFPPVAVAEMPEIELEISVLSPFEIIPAAEALGRIQIGTHGLYITAHGRTGLLLPQVASEWNWTVEEFLANTCGKAGLPADTWRQPGTQIELFSAEVFNERDVQVRLP